MHFPSRLPFPVYQGQLFQVLEAEVNRLLWFLPMLLSSVENTPIMLMNPVTQQTSILDLLLQFPTPLTPVPICPFLKTTDHFFSGKAKTKIKPECYSLSQLS